MDLKETMHAMPMSTINHEYNVGGDVKPCSIQSNVLVLLLVHRGAVTADRKWTHKQIYCYFKDLYCYLVKNFRKDWNKFPEIFRPEISGLITSLAVMPYTHLILYIVLTTFSGVPANHIWTNFLQFLCLH